MTGRRRAASLAVLTGGGILLGTLVALSLGWGARNALLDSADLERRAEEVGLFLDRVDPYVDPDMTYPPAAPVVFTPLIAPWRDPQLLRLAWLILNLAALAGICRLILDNSTEGWSAAMRVVFLGVVAASKPVRLTLGLGQFSLLPLWLVLLSVHHCRRGREALGGLLLGVALVKPTMALPALGLLAARGWWRAILAAATFQAAATAISSLWLGIEPARLTREWLTLARSQRAAGLIDVPSVLERFVTGTSELAGPVAALMLVACAAILVMYRRRSDLALVSVACWFSALFTYHRPYDLVLLVPGFAWLLETARVASGWEARLRLAAVFVFALMLIAPSHPAIVREADYNLAVVAVAYGFFALAIGDLIRGTSESGSARR